MLVLSAILSLIMGIFGSTPHTAPPPDVYVTKWFFAVTQGEAASKTTSLYNTSIDMGVDVQMPSGHTWSCVRMQIDANDDGSVEQGSFICSQGGTMFSVTSVCGTDKPDANLSASVLLQEGQPKMLFTVVCKTEKITPPKGKH